MRAAGAQEAVREEHLDAAQLVLNRAAKVDGELLGSAACEGSGLLGFGVVGSDSRACSIATAQLQGGI